jgi:hypothetical protein
MTAPAPKRASTNALRTNRTLHPSCH